MKKNEGRSHGAAPLFAPALDRVDALPCATVAFGAAVLFLTTFSTHVGTGDAPESVAGVKTLGILHAPGYPAYVLAAHAFGTVFAFGSWAARVNAFSVVCASLAIGLLYLLARALGTTRAGAAIGAAGVATAASFWYNAAFAKHYAFSALLIVAAALLAVSARDETWRLASAGVLFGVAAGASWELSVITLFAVAAWY
ncbi:MAG TPA: DUF2723 domain-containing protein, partial [Acidimicrobiia bacterium]|nr:DUF2723 domain-containing protein [Acidimicrobiia bacterium]